MLEDDTSQGELSPDDKNNLSALDGMRHGIDAMNTGMGKLYDNKKAAGQFVAIAAELEPPRHANDAPGLAEAQGLAQEHADSFRTWAELFAEKAADIVRICGSTASSEVRKRAFATAAYLAHKSYWLNRRPQEVEGAQAWAESLAAAKPGDPVLRIDYGHSPDQPLRFLGGALTTPLQLAFNPRYAPSLGTLSPTESGITATGEMAQYGTLRTYSETSPYTIRHLDLLGGIPNYRTVVGIEAVSAMVGILVEGEMGIYTRAHLVNELVNTGKPLTELGLTEPQLQDIKAGCEAELARINGDHTKEPHSSVGSVSDLRYALRAITAQEQTA